MSRARIRTALGLFIRERIIPPGMSVKEAAERLGVGRPALSNLLNGKASLSPDMAVRLEKAFGADHRELLTLQAKGENAGRLEENKPLPVRSYVPHFLSIKARQIQDWAGTSIAARQELAVLLRRLIHSTGLALRQVDFPGYDNAERKGPDGFLDAGAETPWIPIGESIWEFGVNQDPATKAEDDYAKRTSKPNSKRSSSTFVFVTPRNWEGKSDWASTKSKEGDWKAVRALDASDLEQWLEESVPAQMWLAERLGLPHTGFETLENCWQRWSIGCDPPLHPDIFKPSLTAYALKFKEWLSKPSDRPFVICADSKDEGLAFLARLVQDGETPLWARELATVFDSARTLRHLGVSTSAFVPIVATEEAERELASIYRRLHCIAIRPRNAVDSDPDITLELLGDEAFRTALASMGIDSERADRLAAESGHSPTILRRRLSKIDADRFPQWASEPSTSRALIPMALLGAWHTKSKADRELVSMLASNSYSAVEEDIARLLQNDDPPVWSVANYRGVASKIDSLFAVSKWVIEKDLDDFLQLAELVLSESDPALQLPEDQRWTAGLYGKVRDHSAVLRRGICETLVVLSVHGNHLFQERLGINVEARISTLIRHLLSPMTLDVLLSHDNDLPRYAEAAPDELLALLEGDLGSPKPVVLGLLKPASNGVFGRNYRAGLLWALECLAWKPTQLPRVCMILAQLSQTRIDDNWGNRPLSSLLAIFRSWMPQTSASLEDRIKALELLIKKFPEIGWKVCLSPFEAGSRIGDYSYRPQWRSDASGAGQVVTVREHSLFIRKALDLALSRGRYDARTLGDLVEHLGEIEERDSAIVWDLVDSWCATSKNEDERAELRERIRQFALTRLGLRRQLTPGLRERARRAYDALTSKSAVIRHRWLFAKQWVEESADELESQEPDFQTREERIHRLRLAAMMDIWRTEGIEGFKALLSSSDSPFLVGRYAALSVSTSEATQLLARLLSSGERLEVEECLRGILAALEGKVRARVLEDFAVAVDESQMLQLLRAAPFEQETWREVERHGEEMRLRYWSEVQPTWKRHLDAELNELTDCLLEVHRPRAAFHAVHMDWERLETTRLKRLLQCIVTDAAEPVGTYRIDSFDISAALKSLDGRTGVSSDEMARLEFMFIEALDRSEHGIPNLERQVSESPAMFVEAVALAFRRADEADAPSEPLEDDSERHASAAGAAYELLTRMRRIPGTDRNGAIDSRGLLSWLTEVRELSAQCGRGEIADYCIGELFSKAPAGEDGIRPCLPVREAMETLASQRLADGFSIGTHNSRGATIRIGGGDLERELAAKYRGYSQSLAFDHPYVSNVLERIAADYDREAQWNDSDAKVSRRIRH